MTEDEAGSGSKAADGDIEPNDADVSSDATLPADVLEPASTVTATETAAPEPVQDPSVPHAPDAPTSVEPVVPAVLDDPVAVPAASTEPKRSPPKPGLTTDRFVSIMMLVSLVMVLWNMQPSSRENANTGSRYATIEALVEYGTYNIDSTHYLFTPDKVRARDHFVSSKPPLLPTYGAGVYWTLKKLTGYNIADNEGIVVWVVGVMTGWVGHLVFLIYFYRLCRLLIEGELARLVTMAAACFAYLGVAYATAINNHSVGATLAVVGFYYAYRARHGLRNWLDWVLAGFWLGVLPAIDLSSLALTAFVGVYLLAADWRRALMFALPAAIPGLVTEPLLAHMATGIWTPAYGEASFMQYSGSYFGGHRAGIDALMEPKHVYAFNVLLGHHGVFSMTPLFFFSLYEGVRRLVRREKYFWEIAVLLATFLVVLTFYIVRTHNYGGWCVGMRWLVPVMPWLVLFFGFWLDRAQIGRIAWAAVTFAFAVSAYNVQDGLSSPFQFSVWHNFLEDQPNRNRLGPRWNLSRPHSPPSVPRRPRPARPRRPPPPPPAVVPPPSPSLPAPAPAASH